MELQLDLTWFCSMYLESRRNQPGLIQETYKNKCEGDVFFFKRDYRLQHQLKVKYLENKTGCKKAEVSFSSVCGKFGSEPKQNPQLSPV